MSMGRLGQWIRMPDGTVMHICYSAPRKSPRPSRKQMEKNAAKLEWPATRKALYAAGYQREMHRPARPCKVCGVRIEFWRTPDGKLMPVELDPHSTPDAPRMLCHFATCPGAEKFRKPEHQPRPRQKELFG